MTTIQMTNVEQLLKQYLATHTEMLSAMFTLDPAGTVELLKTNREEQHDALGELIDTMSEDQFSVWQGDGQRTGLAAQFAA